MRSILILSAVVLLAACGQETRNHIEEQVPQQTNRQTLYANAAAHSPRGWLTEVGFYIHDSAPNRIVNAAIHAADTWNSAVGKSVIRYMGRSNKDRGNSLYQSLDDGLTILYYETNWSASTGKNERILATTVWENKPDLSEQIIKGDIILNAEKYLIQDATLDALEADRDSDVVDAETVIVHEIGHLLGLSHWDVDDDSVMNTYTTIGLGETKRMLGASDEENIQAIYSH